MKSEQEGLAFEGKLVIKTNGFKQKSNPPPSQMLYIVSKKADELKSKKLTKLNQCPYLLRLR